MKLILSLLALSVTCPVFAAPANETLNVRGRFIYTAANERVVLRGVNEMFSISRDPTGDWSMKEISKTGANAVRIFTTPTYSADMLDLVLSNAVRHGMIPIPECHAATGKWERLGDCVSYWIRPEIAAVIQKHRRWTLLNIANEAGDEVSRRDFVAGYSEAILRIREAGIDVPLIIDGSKWGQEYNMLLDSWATLNAFDPRRSIIVSAHSYWAGSEEERKAPYRTIIDRVKRDKIPFILGEGPTPSGWDCKASPYSWAMTELDKADISWLAWSWGMVENRDCQADNRYDITDGGKFGRWKASAGAVLMVDHPASVQKTARRPCSIPNAGKNCIRPGRWSAAEK